MRLLAAFGNPFIMVLVRSAEIRNFLIGSVSTKYFKYLRNYEVKNVKSVSGSIESTDLFSRP
jgi:hypothetical protein